MGSSRAPQGAGSCSPGRLLLVALPSGHALPSLPERHREPREVFLLLLDVAGVEGGDSWPLGLPRGPLVDKG